jgi:Phytanoyl-CoA dioxygenase (PhyH)
MALAQEENARHRSIREVSDAEIDFYRVNGWVKLDQLISREFASELLDAAKTKMGESGEGHALRPGKDLVGFPSWHDYHDIAEEDDTFAALGFSKGIGRAAQQLMQRDVSVRMYANMLAVKLGKNQGPNVTEYARTDIHQDFPTLAFDRNGYLGFWIALDEVTPEMGSLQFYTGSQSLGSLGRWFEGRDLLDVYPNIERDFPLAQTNHLQPGDATVHHGFMVHGARENLTDRPRWAYVIGYFPGDTRFTGAQTPGDEHIYDAERYGLTVGEPFDHPAFHLVYP